MMELGGDTVFASLCARGLAGRRGRLLDLFLHGDGVRWIERRWRQCCGYTCARPLAASLDCG